MMFGLLSSSYDKRSQSLSEKTSTRYETIPSPQDHSLAQKVSKIALLNLREHDLDICACEECIYSRQLNRKHRIGLELSKHSSYRAQFDTKSPHPNPNPTHLKVDYEALQKRNNKSAVIDNSSYGANYSKDAPYEKPQKKRPEDELKFVGPVQHFSSYGEQYPSFKNNANPYIKPTEVTVPNTLKMNLRSVYQSNFNGVTRPRAESGKIPDNLHGGLPWTGGSTYRQLFKGASPSLVRDAPSRMEMKVDDPNYAHQYQTTYRNEYLLGRKKCSRGQQQSNPLLARLQQTLQL